MLKSLPLTARLTLYFTLASAALVMGLGLVFTLLADQHFLDLDRIALRDKMDLIGGILRSANSSGDARSRLSEALGHHHGLHAIVRGPAEQMLYESDDFIPSEQLLAMRGDGSPREGLRWQHNGRSLHGHFLPVIPAFAPDSRLEVLVAVETEKHAQFMRELNRSLLLYALLAVLLSGMLGWLAAYKAMAPLRAMKAQATTISAHKLDTRMSLESVPVEMADLATEFNHMLDRLQEDFQRLSSFSADLAHELRTPINNLMTQTQVALASKRDANFYRDILASNAEEFQRLARMVSDMLFLAKTERGVDLPTPERFAAEEEVRALLEFYEAVAAEKGVRLTQSGTGQLRADRLMFRRALSNLLSNALRHTHEKGEVSVRIDATADAARVTVENSGTDIDPRALPRLFDRFYRADSARSHGDSDGIGLGLAITRAIVEAHGGTATVHSAQGRTRFTLQLPS